MRVMVGTSALIVVAAGCGGAPASTAAAHAGADSTAHPAHDAYTSAINSNNLDSILG